MIKVMMGRDLRERRDEREKREEREQQERERKRCIGWGKHMMSGKYGGSGGKQMVGEGAWCGGR